MNKKALLLDMNSTFMFGEDRFGVDQDYSIHYQELGGTLPSNEVNELILLSYRYLDERYPDEKYRHSFPSLENALLSISESDLPNEEIQRIINTFAFHELGHIPSEYVEVLHSLHSSFTLAAVIDIWSPKQRWIEAFKQYDIYSLFSAFSFSSDHGMVKPSPEPFKLVMNQLKLTPDQCLVIGDAVRRDLGGAMLADIDCVLVGGSKSSQAVVHYPTLLDFYKAI